MKETIKHRFDMTLKNCRAYEELGLRNTLLNEIGVLRGIYYCMEIEGIDPGNQEEFLHFIEVQQSMRDTFPRGK